MIAAVLGAGGMGGTVISHLKKCPDVKGIIAYDIREERMPVLRERFGIEATTDLASILGNPDVPLVFVTASNDAHKALVLHALEAGKAVMCEKPMANTLEDAREMVDAAERRGAFLQIGFELRYSKLYTQVQDWIDAGLLGDIINTHCYYIASAFARASWRTQSAVSGGMFGEKLSHYVDLPRWWIGDEVVDIFATCAPNLLDYADVRDNYHATYRFRNGAVSHLTFMMGPAAHFRGDTTRNIVTQQAGDGHVLRYLVVGTKGAAETDIFPRTIKRWQFGQTPETWISDWVQTVRWDEADDHIYFHNTLDQTHDIVRRVRAGEPPMTSARDAFETMKLCFAAERSADTGRIVPIAELEC